MIYDHQVSHYSGNSILVGDIQFLQMCCDCDSGILYVLGGRIVCTDLCSGLYAYHTVDQHWLSLSPDQSDTDFSSRPPILPRSGHVMLYHPVSV